MKIFLRILVVIAVVFVGGYIAAHVVVKGKITSALDKEIEKGNLAYATVSLNLWNGRAAVDSVTYRFQANQVFAEKLEVKNFGYYTYLVNGDVHLGELLVDRPKVKLVEQEKPDSLQDKKESKPKLEKKIKVDKIVVNQANLSLKNDSLTKLRLVDYTLHLNKVKASAESLKNKIPFTYETYAVKGGKLKYHLNTLQNLEVDSLDINTRDAVVHQVRLTPNYSREDYVKVIPYEKDLIDMRMQRLRVQDYKLDLNTPNGKLTSSKVELDSIDITIFRDKRVTDDPRKKKLYSRMLRELPLKLAIDSLKIQRTDLVYEEVQEKTGKTGKVFFKDMKVNARTITNIGLARKDFPKTKFDISCQFMDAAPLNVAWEFQVNKPADNFRISGRSFHIPPPAMNSFFRPAFNMEAEGKGIDKLYFDFYGNRNLAQGQLKMVYDSLKIKVLRKNSRKKNGFLSFVANVFVNKNRKENDGPVDVSDVERNKTKSFWNYFWKCIFAGLKKTLV